MSITTHVKTLHNKHQELEEELHNAYTHHLPTTEIAMLKKQKLKLKDKMKSLHSNPDNIKKAA